MAAKRLLPRSSDGEAQRDDRHTHRPIIAALQPGGKYVAFKPLLDAGLPSPSVKPPREPWKHI